MIVHVRVLWWLCSRFSVGCVAEEAPKRGKPKGNGKGKAVVAKKGRAKTTTTNNNTPTNNNTHTLNTAAIGGDYLARFLAQYRREYGFVLDRRVIVDDIRVRAIGHTLPHSSSNNDNSSENNNSNQQAQAASSSAAANSKSRNTSASSAAAAEQRARAAAAIPSHNTTAKHKTASVYFSGGWRNDTRVFALSELSVGDVVSGPAVLINNTSTIVVNPDASAKVCCVVCVCMSVCVWLCCAVLCAVPSNVQR